jgi:hypothetical protein
MPLPLLLPTVLVAYFHNSELILPGYQNDNTIRKLFDLLITTFFFTSINIGKSPISLLMLAVFTHNFH